MRNPNAAVSDPTSFITSSGDVYHVLYAPSLAPDGSVILKESGKDNISDLINSYASSCDMSVIVNRFLAGDTSALAVNLPMYGDLTSLPKTPLEMLDVVRRAEYDFDHLPVDIRSKFDNSFERWFAAAGSADWYAAMQQPVTQPEVEPAKA